MNLTREEIKIALECCAGKPCDCGGCPLKDFGSANCVGFLCKTALEDIKKREREADENFDTIVELTKDNVKLNIQVTGLEKELAERIREEKRLGRIPVLSNEQIVRLAKKEASVKEALAASSPPQAEDAEGERDESPIGRVLDGILDKIRGEISRVQAVSSDRYPILTVFVTGQLYRFLEGMRRNCYSMLKDEKDIPRGKIFGCEMRTYEGDGLAFYVADTPEVQI